MGAEAPLGAIVDLTNFVKSLFNYKPPKENRTAEQEHNKRNAKPRMHNDEPNGDSRAGLWMWFLCAEGDMLPSLPNLRRTWLDPAKDSPFPVPFTVPHAVPQAVPHSVPHAVPHTHRSSRRSTWVAWNLIEWSFRILC